MIAMDRSLYTIIKGVRAADEFITAYLDASQVYGSDQARAQECARSTGPVG